MVLKVNQKKFLNLKMLSKAFTILNREEIIDALDRAAEEINNKMVTWLSEGSGWTIEVILQHCVNIVKYLPLRGNSYLPLPEELRNPKKGLINLKNEDDKCIRNWPLPIEAFQDQCKQTIINKHN